MNLMLSRPSLAWHSKNSLRQSHLRNAGLRTWFAEDVRQTALRMTTYFLNDLRTHEVWGIEGESLSLQHATPRR
ncbi:hypothetical protein SBA5_140027 [Candidatus Sulfotelmatomonas gaucii]|uniref:Uncharacterized protein n=1 Tax=Candidatus Sulfuritelmatomonas gaucii TaxID=2043161 RepID=A0A2N9L4J6_9BACT|nr:hypothetical protein SBA5_140027 [Candidatus Sulfotelmatomonas gaucii]